MMMLSNILNFFRPHPKKNVNVYEKITKKSENFLQKTDEGTQTAIICHLQQNEKGSLPSKRGESLLEWL